MSACVEPSTRLFRNPDGLGKLLRFDQAFLLVRFSIAQQFNHGQLQVFLYFAANHLFHEKEQKQYQSVRNCSACLLQTEINSGNKQIQNSIFFVS